jgi:FkbM family methyltransferase
MNGTLGNIKTIMNIEQEFTIPKIRRGHKLNIGDSSCYWFEMDHTGEGYRTLLDIFDQYLNRYNWDKFILPGSTVVDVGGHSGDTTIPMQFLARGTVLSVEPNPIIKPYLDFACTVNSHLGKFVTAIEAVTTSDTDKVTILDHNNALCNGGIIDDSWTDELKQRMANIATQSIDVPGLTLEHLCQKYLTEEEINKIGFIKTDTEGHDVSIIESSADFIDRLRPVLFIEWFFAYTEVENQKMFKVIEELGYDAFYPETLTPASINQRSDDLVLIHKSKVSEYL